ncbi:MAG: cell division protein CrgA [Actinobacteria bacterium]|nr:cell division protein CrgA [Actinomycetota bacterium]
MPESRGRTRKKGSRYQLEPARKKKTKRMPRWYAPLVLVVMGAGVVVIVWNYFQGTRASNGFLWLGLGLIGIGFAGTTQIR